jgi:hypothetical protein
MAQALLETFVKIEGDVSAFALLLIGYSSSYYTKCLVSFF